MFHREVLLAGAGALALAATPAIAAGASQTSHARLFANDGGHCRLAASRSPFPTIRRASCSAARRALRERRGQVGDPFVEIGRKGKPKVILVSQDELGTNKAVTLASGATWSKLGVTCEVNGTAVTCTNAAKHGFTIGNRKYKSF